MPAECISSALFELINILSRSVLLVEDGPIGNIRETPAKPALPAAA
jgi:hypothetical protein